MKSKIQTPRIQIQHFNVSPSYTSYKTIIDEVNEHFEFQVDDNRLHEIWSAIARKIMGEDGLTQTAMIIKKQIESDLENIPCIPVYSLIP